MYATLAGSAPLLLGFALGMRHAFDADHIVAMSTIATRERSLVRAAFLGGAWGAGHCVTLFAVGLLVLFFRLPMQENWSVFFERVVGIMLVVLGTASLVARRKRDAGTAAHASAPSHRRPFLVGVVHGLAGSGALALAVLATIPSRGAGLLYIALFGVGAIGGMMLITFLFAIPARFATGVKAGAGGWLSAAASVGSVAFGIYYLYHGA